MRTSEERVTAIRSPHLDNLNTVLVAWAIGGHALLGYSATGGWAYDEVREVTLAPATELWLVAIIGPSGLFMMGLFFFVAGLLAEHALARHGLRRYLGDRTLRLGLPWLVSVLLVWPVSVWLAYVVAGWRVSPWWVLSHRDPLLDSGSLWFALVLLLYSMAFALWRRARPYARPRPSRPLTGAHLAAAVGVIALSSFVVRLWFPARSGQIGDLHLWQWTQCLGLFTLGVVAARRGWHRHVPDRLSRTWTAVTLATLARAAWRPAGAAMTGPGSRGSRTIVLDGPVHYVDFGGPADRPTVVLVHGPAARTSAGTSWRPSSSRSSASWPSTCPASG
jgi:hypothetical protein